MWKIILTFKVSFGLLRLVLVCKINYEQIRHVFYLIFIILGYPLLCFGNMGAS